METRRTANKEKEMDKDIIAELLMKTDITNDLLRELIDAVKRSNNVGTSFNNVIIDNIENTEDTEETYLKTTDMEVSSYQSPTLMIQRETNELMLQKEAYRIKQRIKAEWSRLLNYRKQTYYKQINNANHANYFEKWISQGNPIIPRKFRIKEIRGEPKNQTEIRVEMAINRVNGEISLLRMRAENNQLKVLKIDEEIDQMLHQNASGFILEKLQNMWKSDCQKEEDRSFNRWRYTEAWLLDYAKNYGKDNVKQPHIQPTSKKPKPTTGSHKQTTKQNLNASYASVVGMDSENAEQTETTSPVTNNSKKHGNSSTSNRQGREQQYARQTLYRNQRVDNDKLKNQQTDCRRRINQNHYGQRPKRHRPSNIYRDGKTTFIGRGVQHHFLGGGKPNRGQRYIPRKRQQRTQMY